MSVYSALDSCSLLYRYKGVLHAASDSIAERYGSSSGILALNLGPVWSNADAYKLFGDNVIEISFKEWESPPGLGICPLDVIFSVCYSISSWLNLNADHVVVCTPSLSMLVAVVHEWAISSRVISDEVAC